jgi:hypothetical protein
MNETSSDLAFVVWTHSTWSSDMFDLIHSLTWLTSSKMDRTSSCVAMVDFMSATLMMSSMITRWWSGDPMIWSASTIEEVDLLWPSTMVIHWLWSARHPEGTKAPGGMEDDIPKGRKLPMAWRHDIPKERKLLMA